MTYIKTMNNLVRIANRLDDEGDYATANELTHLLKRCVSGDKQAIRAANTFTDWWNNVKNEAGQVGEGVEQAVGGVWNAANGGAGLADSAATAAPAAVAGGSEWVKNQFKNKVINPYLQENFVQPIKQQYQNQSEQQLLQSAITAHKSGQDGWAVLNAGIGFFPANIQAQIKQQFMQSTGIYK